MTALSDVICQECRHTADEHYPSQVGCMGNGDTGPCDCRRDVVQILLDRIAELTVSSSASIDLVKAAIAALSQNKTYPADVDYARRCLQDALK